MRLVKFVSNHSALARRKADEAIFQGRVTVNGQIEKNPARNIDEDSERVTLDGQLLEQQVKVYHLLKVNKPSGYLSTTDDERGRKTILDILPKEVREHYGKLFCIGRLDKESEGLMLLTNNGDLALKLSHPRYEKEKEYLVFMKGALTREQIQKLEVGIIIQLEDGAYLTKPATVRIQEINEKRTKLSIIITEGKKRQIRRMAEALGTHVTYLQRIRIGNILLGDLPVGQYQEIPSSDLHFL